MGQACMAEWCFAANDDLPGNLHTELEGVVLDRNALRLVADSNYQLRNRWPIPRTVTVTYTQCRQALSQARVPGWRWGGPTVSFSGMTTADALLYFGRSLGRSVCGLNFANGARVGGGYKNGAGAQEEDLCRRIPNLYTTLHRAMKEGHYPFGPCTCRSKERPGKYSDVLFTPGAWLARAGARDGYTLLQDGGVPVSIVSAAAPNRKAGELSRLDLMSDTVRNIFATPKLMQPEITTLVLGAWGCGAFGGDPHEISGLFASALAEEDLGREYQEVHFAMPLIGGHNPSSNADVFRGTFSRRGLSWREL
mmetsp:Transcript_61247/g.138162  ORF Transcript_61247/g.138162 Transcript_61247/m.138162 type:complete len:308 (-) Transcript_61247:5-928(-)